MPCVCRAHEFHAFYAFYALTKSVSYGFVARQKVQVPPPAFCYEQVKTTPLRLNSIRHSLGSSDRDFFSFDGKRNIAAASTFAGLGRSIAIVVVPLGRHGRIERIAEGMKVVFSSTS